MKSFSEFVMNEEVNLNSDKIDELEFIDNINEGPKEVYSYDSFLENPDKQMKYVYSFGKESSPQPYELTFTSRKFYPKSWDVNFTKGFDKLESKDKVTIERCLKGLKRAIEGFACDDVDFEEQEDTEKIQASVKYKDSKMKEIIHSFFDKTKFRSLEGRKYHFNNSYDSASEYNFVAQLKKA